VTPFETVKVRMQTKENMGRYVSSIQCAREILRAEGLRGLYAGFWPTCLRNNVFNSCYFGSIHWCKGYLPAPESFEQQAGQNIGVGIIAGLVATAFKMPFDILKSRMQGQVPNATGQLEYSTMTNAMVQILRTEGPTAFYKGTAVTAARITLGFPISFVAFEAVASIFEDEIR
jgi:solute carrier family 25 2-oxodicarboxylate transporter 21